MYDAKAAALTECQQYTAEKQKNDKQFERQLAEFLLYVKALDAESDKLQQNALVKPVLFGTCKSWNDGMHSLSLGLTHVPGNFGFALTCLRCRRVH